MWPLLVPHVMLKVPGINCISIVRNWPITPFFKFPNTCTLFDCICKWGVAGENLLTTVMKRQWLQNWVEVDHKPMGFAYLGDGRLSALQLLSIFTLKGWFRILKSLSAHYPGCLSDLANVIVFHCEAAWIHGTYFGNFQCLYILELKGSLKACTTK